MSNVATLGAAYSANKGAASMLQALADELPRRFGPVRITAVSTHATGDRRAFDAARNPVEVASQTPLELVARDLPLAIVAGALRRAGLPWRWSCATRALRALADADVVADISGISFADGRRPAVLVYNALVDAVPLLLGRPVVKCAQAMGPIRSLLNRLAARWVLARLAVICPRGEVTESHLEARGLTNLTPAGDLAFWMEVDADTRARAGARLSESAGDGPFVVISPSQVVDTACRQRGIDYAGIMAGLCDGLAADGDLTPVVIAHSAQADSGENHMNDLPLCRRIAGRLARPDEVAVIDEDLGPAELRAIIGAATMCVTSRFHAMISSLAEGVPPLVIGWSHKYAEVLDRFELGATAMTYDQLTTVARVHDVTRVIADHATEVGARVEAHLPAARDHGAANFTALARAGLAEHR